MKRIPQMKADNRTIEEKAFGLIFAMNDDSAQKLLEKLSSMKNGYHSKRASMFVGKP